MIMRSEEERMMMDTPVSPGPPPDAPMDMDMPMEPQGMDLPETAVVMEVGPDEATLQLDSGETISVPLHSFPIPPSEGMRLVRAEVIEITGDMMIAEAGGQQVDFSLNELNDVFEIGDYFWLPEPPTTPDMMTEF